MFGRKEKRLGRKDGKTRFCGSPYVYRLSAQHEDGNAEDVLLTTYDNTIRRMGKWDSKWKPLHDLRFGV